LLAIHVSILRDVLVTADEVEKILGGYWYSFPEDGECKGSAQPGDGSGCTWKAAKLKKKINATCLGDLVDASTQATLQLCVVYRSCLTERLCVRTGRGCETGCRLLRSVP